MYSPQKCLKLYLKDSLFMILLTNDCKTFVKGLLRSFVKVKYKSKMGKNAFYKVICKREDIDM